MRHKIISGHRRKHHREAWTQMEVDPSLRFDSGHVDLAIIEELQIMLVPMAHCHDT